MSLVSVAGQSSDGGGGGEVVMGPSGGKRTDADGPIAAAAPARRRGSANKIMNEPEEKVHRNDPGWILPMCHWPKPSIIPAT